MRSLFWFVAFVLALTLTSDLSAQTVRQWRIAFVPAAETPDFWAAVKAGAEKAQSEATNEKQEIRLLWLEPKAGAMTERAEQMTRIEEAVVTSAHGIIVTPVHATAILPSVELAVRQGIKVVTMGTPLTYPLLTSSVAINNYQAGAEAATLLGRVLGERGKVIVLRHVQAVQQIEKRELGFLDAMRKIYPEIEVISPDLLAAPDEASARRACESLLRQYGSGVQGIFTAGLQTTEALQRALVEAGLSSKIKHVGYDHSAALVTALRQGQLAGLIIQDPFTLGYLATKTMVEALQGKRVSPRVEAPVYTLTLASIDKPEIQAIINPEAKK
jgi:ribose transport system substrate-binding protein